MNSASRHSPLAPLRAFLKRRALAAVGLLVGSAGCAIDASDPAAGQQQQAVVVVANTGTKALAGPQLAQVPVLIAPVDPDDRPVVVLSAPVTTNGGGIGEGGNDEGPRPNPWTPPPESKSEDPEGTGKGGGTTTGGTGTNAPEVEGAAGSKGAPTK